MKSRTLVASLAAATLLLTGCVVAPPPRYDYYGEPVMVAPPPPRVEYVGPPPAVGYLWIDGFWSWRSNRHVWVPGRWEAPRPGYRWEPHRWDRDGDRWRERGGRWEDQRRHDHDRDRRGWR